MINEFWVVEKRKEMIHMYTEALKLREAGSMLQLAFFPGKGEVLGFLPRLPAYQRKLNRVHSSLTTEGVFHSLGTDQEKQKVR